MIDHILDLKEALSENLLNAEYDPKANTEESMNIRALADAVRQFDVGQIEYDELTALFARLAPNFDITHWLDKMVGEGIYA